MKIAIVSLFWNESRYLKEWIEFHRVVGVDKFYLVNNNSTDNYMSILEPYIKENIVVLSNIDINIHNNKSGRNNEVILVEKWVKEMNRIVLNSKEDWVIHVSTDEFMYPTKLENLKEVLIDTPPNVGEISVNWLLFGHNNIELSDNDLLIDKIRMSSHNYCKSNLHVKPIMRQKAISSIPSVHYSMLKSNYIKTDTNYDIKNFNKPYETKNWIDSKILVNHYRYRDLKYSKEKIKIYQLWGRDVDLNSISNMFNDRYSDQIIRFLPKLINSMK